LWDSRAETLSPEINSGIRGICKFSPDGSKIVIAANNKIVRIWDVASRKEVGKLPGTASLQDVAVSPDGKLVATVGTDGKGRIWDVTTGKQLGEPLQHEDRIKTVAFSPDKRRLATSSADKTIRLWDSTTSKPIGSPMKLSDAPRTVTFTLDGRNLLSASGDGELRIWDAITGKPLGTPFRDSALSAPGDDSRTENEQLRESINLSNETKKLIKSLQLPQISRLSEFLRWTEGVSGLRFGADGQLHSISPEDRLSRLYTPFVDANDESKWAKLIRWVQMNPEKRPESP